LVNNAQSLRELSVDGAGETFPGDPSGLTALANALREHTALEELYCFDYGSRIEAAQSTALDLVLRVLPACLHLRTVTIMTASASADAMKNLLQLGPATDLDLVLKTEHWLAAADAIRRGRCNVKKLTLAMYREATVDATEAAKAIASAIRLDRSLEDLTLERGKDFTDEMGVALAEALTVNETLRQIILSVGDAWQLQDSDALSVPAYEVFSAMLRVNTSLVLELPPFETAGTDERLVDSRNQMRIEQRLNQVGRGRLLASSQTPRKEWVDALNELNSSNVDETPVFQVSCLISLLLLHPAVCMS
jgi:hypothetical protein